MSVCHYCGIEDCNCDNPILGRFGDHFVTYTGIKFFPFDPQVCEVSIEDIAHSLSMSCRFLGHIKDFYSVAEHAIHVSHIVPLDFAWEGLHHDDSEAYMGDMIRPLKRHSELGGPYKKYEEGVERVLAKNFQLRYPYPEVVKHADNTMLATEKQALQIRPDFKPHFADEGLTYKPTNLVTLHCWPPKRAEAEFLARFFYLQRNRGV